MAFGVLSEFQSQRNSLAPSNRRRGVPGESRPKSLWAPSQEGWGPGLASKAPLPSNPYIGCLPQWGLLSPTTEPLVSEPQFPRCYRRNPTLHPAVMWVPRRRWRGDGKPCRRSHRGKMPGAGRGAARRGGSGLPAGLPGPRRPLPPGPSPSCLPSSLPSRALLPACCALLTAL